MGLEHTINRRLAVSVDPGHAFQLWTKADLHRKVADAMKRIGCENLPCPLDPKVGPKPPGHTGDPKPYWHELEDAIKEVERPVPAPQPPLDFQIKHPTYQEYYPQAMEKVRQWVMDRKHLDGGPRSDWLVDFADVWVWVAVPLAAVGIAAVVGGAIIISATLSVPPCAGAGACILATQYQLLRGVQLL